MLTDSDFHVAIQVNMERLLTMFAFGFDENRKMLVFELPLHEGRRNGIFCSGTVETFTAIK